MGKSLYTTVRELVENSLDSAEGIGELPDIAITMCVLCLNSLSRLRYVRKRGQCSQQKVGHTCGDHMHIGGAASACTARASRVRFQRCCAERKCPARSSMICAEFATLRAWTSRSF